MTAREGSERSQTAARAERRRSAPPRRRTPWTLMAAVALAAASSVASIVLPASAWAAPPASANGKDSEPSAAVSRAVERWRKGDWSGVRAILEPLVADGGSTGDAARDEIALRTLADATLLDGDLDVETRELLARRYVDRLLERDPLWTPPPGLHGPGLYALTERIRSERELASAERCEVERLSCGADLYKLRVEHERLEAERLALQSELASQPVEVRSYVARNRAVALVPFGVGHFYNGRPGLGGGFLAAELGLGGFALGAYLRRVYKYNCVRTDGFRTNSLNCDFPNAREDEVLAWRQAEQAFAGLFVIAVIADVVVAQATFRPVRESGRKVVPRGELDRDDARAPVRKSRRRKGARISVRPASGPEGAGIVLSGAF